MAFTNTGGGDHGNSAWTISVDTNIAGVHTGITTFTVNTGITATVEPYNGSAYGTLDVSADVINIIGNITGTGGGHGGGGGGGGGGGAENDGTGQGTAGSGGAAGSGTVDGANGTAGTAGGKGNPATGGTGGDGGLGGGTYGGNDGTNGGYAASASNGDTTTDKTLRRGSGGGGGDGGLGASVPSDTSTHTGGAGGGGGAGGKGGATIYLRATTSLTISGNIFNKGTKGGDGTAGGDGESAAPRDAGDGGDGGSAASSSNGAGGAAGSSYLSVTRASTDGQDGGKGAGGGVLLDCNIANGIIISGGIDVRGGSSLTSNGGTIKIFYKGTAPTGTKYYGRLYTVAYPDTPPAPTCTYVSDNQINVSLTPVSGADSYRIARSTDGAAYVTLATGITALTYADTGISGKDHYYRYKYKGESAIAGDGSYGAISDTVWSSNSVATSVVMEYRTSDDGATWSAWGSDFSAIANSRYLQWRATFSGGGSNTGYSSAVYDVSITYLPA